jgi:hypothetical protein
MRHLVAGIAADEQHELGRVHHPVGRRRGVVADHADMQRVPRRDHPSRAERGGDRRPQHLRPAARQRCAIADNDDHALGGQQRRHGRLHRRRVRPRPMPRRGPGPKRGRCLRRLAGLDELAHQPVEVEMHRARRRGDGGGPGLAELPRQVGRLMHLRRVLRHRREERRMRHLLVGVAVLMTDRLVPGQRQHRAAPQPGILQPRREIGRADGLRRHHARASGDPRIGIGHVDRRLFGMREDRLHADPFQFQQGPPQHRVDEEEMRLAGGLQAARQPFIAQHHSGSAPLISNASSTRETQL